MARHWVAAHLRDLPAEVTGCAALLTSELVTNAVLHAATPMCVTLHILPDRIRVDVADGNPAFPSVKEYGTDAATGRGLTLFNTLASNWGVQAVDGGKIVWFELPVDFPVAPDERLGRQLPLRPHRHHATRTSTVTPDDSPDAVGPAPRHTGGAAPEVERGVRGAVPRAPADEGAIGQRGRGAAPARAPRPSWCPRSAPASTGSGRAWTTCGRRRSTTRSNSSTGRSNCRNRPWRPCEFYDAMLDEADEFGLAQRLLTLPASRDERGGATLVPLRADRAAARQGPGGLGRQPLPRRAAGGVRPLSGAGQRFLAVAFFNTLP